MEKIAFLYVNHQNQMICSDYFRREGRKVIGYSLVLDEFVSYKTDYKSFKKLDEYYQRKCQMILVFNETTPEEAQKVLGAALPGWDLEVNPNQAEQDLADEMERMGMFGPRNPDDKN